jgi:hypothetical protein
MMRRSLPRQGEGKKEGPWSKWMVSQRLGWVDFLSTSKAKEREIFLDIERCPPQSIYVHTQFAAQSQLTFGISLPLENHQPQSSKKVFGNVSVWRAHEREGGW